MRRGRTRGTPQVLLQRAQCDAAISQCDAAISARRRGARWLSRTAVIVQATQRFLRGGEAQLSASQQTQDSTAWPGDCQGHLLPPTLSKETQDPTAWRTGIARILRWCGSGACIWLVETRGPAGVDIETGARIRHVRRQPNQAGGGDDGVGSLAAPAGYIQGISLEAVAASRLRSRSSSLRL